MLSSRRKKRKSILQRQSPKRRWRILRKIRSKVSTKAFLYTAAAGLTLALVFTGYSVLKTMLAIELTQNTKFDIRVDSYDQPPALVSAEIKNYIAKLIERRSRLELGELSRHLQFKYKPEALHLIHTGNQSVHAQVKLRRPVLRVKLGTIKLISDQGIVYGKAEKRHATLRLLSGVKAMVPPLAWQDVVALDNDSQVAIQRALDLNKLLDQFDMPILQFSYIKNRGFLLESNGDYPSVMVGFEEFKTRLTRLKIILTRLATDKSYATSVELDYQGKVFVKERSVTE